MQVIHRNKTNALIMKTLTTITLCSAIGVVLLSLIVNFLPRSDAVIGKVGIGSEDPEPEDNASPVLNHRDNNLVQDNTLQRRHRENPTRQVYIVEPTQFVEIDLDGTWTIVNSNGSVNVDGVVPGNVHTALERGGLIGDPYFRYNDDIYRWIVHDNWTYSRTFTVSSDQFNFRVKRLVCHGLDTVATITLNDVKVGVSDNQFVGYVFDISNVLQVGENSITVEFQSAVEYAQALFDAHDYVVPPACPPAEYHPECHANFIRKAQCSFSWDWGPSFPTQGIWRTINIEAFNIASIRSVTPLPYRDANGWQLNITTFFDFATPAILSRGTFKVEIPDLGLTQSRIVILEQGAEAVSIILAAPNADAWWPRGYGSATMYDLHVSFTSDDAVPTVITQVVRTAFRVIELVEDPVPTGSTFYFKINNVPIFMKGSNWIPVDSFLDKVSYIRVRSLLQAAVDANMNTIRIWGGGVYESDDFYDIADEFGLLVWQDMMFACSMYPVHEAFLTSVRLEMNYQVRRLSRHPSLVAWTANNENEGALVDNWYGTGGANYPQYKADYVTLYIDTVRSEILTQDLSRPFLSSSPTNGKVTEDNGWISESPRPGEPQHGDVHFYDYESDCMDYTIFPPTRYASEYGYQSWPAHATLAKIANSEDLYYRSEFFNNREHHHGAGNGTDTQLRHHFTWPDTGDIFKDFKSYIYLTQVVQAICYQSETEFYRRGSNNINVGTMGALYWQHNDIWQAPSWSTIDYDGRWKMAHYFGARFFADPILSIIKEGSNVAVYTVTDQNTAANEAQLVVQIWSWSGTFPQLQWITNITVFPQGSYRVFNQPLDEMLNLGSCSGPEACFITGYVEKGGKRLTAVNAYYPTSWKDAVGMTDSLIQVVSVDLVDSMTFTVRIFSASVSAFTWLETGDILGRFSDNGLLLTDRYTVLQFHAAQPGITVEQLHSSISITTLWSIYNS